MTGILALNCPFSPGLQVNTPRSRRTSDATEETAAVPEDAASPAEKEKPGGDLHDVYFRLRQSILSGSIAPGAILNQVHIARLYGVSRTPVREALRMLQAEGLVEAQFQHRMRVTEVTPQEVDAVYATWILVQSLGVALTVPRITPAELDLIRSALHDMNESAPVRHGSSADWDNYHVIFHRRLVMHAGPVITESIENSWSRSERARRAFMRTAPQSWLDSEEEHNTLVEAYADRSIARAVQTTSRQLARIARIVIGNIDPGYEPVAIRQALNLTASPISSGIDGVIGNLLARPAKNGSTRNGPVANAPAGRAAKARKAAD
jgi:DNA-binding GntR family transcriptional regulator